MQSFENALGQSIFSHPSEKSFLDKVFDRYDVEKIREIVSKPRLTRSDLMELLNLLSSNEFKLLNYKEWDRYIMAKFFVWIREFVAIAENLYDYEDDLKIKEKTCRTCNGLIGGKCKCEAPIPIFKLSPRSRQIFENNMRFMEHNTKFLVDLYLNLARTTLSLDATLVLETLRNKYEISYPQQGATQPVEEKPGFRIKWK